MATSARNGNICAVQCLLCSVLNEQCDRHQVCSTCAAHKAVCRRKSLKPCVPCQRAGIDCDEIWPCKPCLDMDRECTLLGNTMLWCHQCRKRHTKCNGETPCDVCLKRNSDCYFDTEFTGRRTCDNCKVRKETECDGRRQGCSVCKELDLVCSYGSEVLPPARHQKSVRTMSVTRTQSATQRHQVQPTKQHLDAPTVR